jgi:3-phosphoshikimate 1-carboxyvinyltransferase
MLAGILAGTSVGATLDGDDSLRRRPVARIVAPLRAMGADISARADDSLPPVTVRGGVRLSAIEHTSTVPSAQVKSAICWRPVGGTTVCEPVATTTERMLRARDVTVSPDWSPTVVISLRGARRSRRSTSVAGDVSSAVFWLVAGACHPDAN